MGRKHSEGGRKSLIEVIVSPISVWGVTMRDKILKILSIITWLHLFNFLVGYIVMACLLKVEPGGTIHKWFVALWMLIGIALVISILLVAGKDNKAKADIFYLGEQSFDEWIEAFVSTIAAYGYQLVHSVNDDPDYSFNLYIQEQSQEPLSCIIIVKTHELSDSIIDCVNDKITDPLRTYLNCKTIRTSVDMTVVFCVEKVTPAFYRLVNCHMAQGPKNGRLIVGISSGGKRIYVGSFKEGFGKQKYRKLRENFIAMARLEGQEPIGNSD